MLLTEGHVSPGFFELFFGGGACIDDPAFGFSLPCLFYFLLHHVSIGSIWKIFICFLLFWCECFIERLVPTVFVLLRLLGLGGVSTLGCLLLGWLLGWLLLLGLTGWLMIWLIKG